MQSQARYQRNLRTLSFPLPWWVCGVGYVLFLVGMGIVTWAEAVNKFFEPTVRIQADRGQRVIDSGPYAVVRHPLYFGALFYVAATSLVLGSWWGLATVPLVALGLAIRIGVEEEALRKGQQGYSDYARRVRWRLIPFIW